MSTKVSRQTLTVFLFCSSFSFLLWLVAGWAVGVDHPLYHPWDDQYTLQAQAWAKGMLDLEPTPKQIELVKFKGRLYNSFPPTPAIFEFLLNPLFESKTPIAFFLYVASYASFVMAAFFLAKFGVSASAALFLSFAVIFCGNALYPMAHGGVWYQAQIYALFLGVLSFFLAAYGGRFWGSCFLSLGLAVGCRPFYLFYFPLLILVLHKYRGKNFKSLALQSLCWGMPVMIVLALHNYVRFGIVWEFGHNFLPNMGRQKDLFALRYFVRNIYYVFFAVPEVDTTAKTFLLANPMGNAFWFCNPLFAWILIRTVFGKYKHKSYLLLVLATLWFPLLAHESNGWIQFGYRYAIDLFLWSLVIVALNSKALIFSLRSLLFVSIFSAGVNLWGAHWRHKVLSHQEIMNSFRDLSCATCQWFQN